MRVEKEIRVFLLVLIVILGGTFASRGMEVQAASENKVRFLDNSGRYLQKSSGGWYLKNSKNQKISGLCYLNIPNVEFLKKGFYMFDRNGKLLNKQAVYYFNNKTVSGVVFDKYHITDSNGRISKGEKGLVKVSVQTVNGKKFEGIYYVEGYGKLADHGTVRYMKQRQFCGKNFQEGYYYFDGTGKICMQSAFRKINRTIQGKKFNGTYYFGSGNGRLTEKAGWITYKKQKYYVDKNGKMAANCWKGGYYLKSNGTIAKNTKTPDGKYVDYQGKKSTKSEYALSAFKAQLKNYTSSYGGNWSVYVKDLKTGNVINLNDQAMYPASTIKAFVMASTYDQIQSGKIKKTSYINSLLWNMITVSDNECYNELVRRQGGGSFVNGAATVNKYLKKNGYTSTGCHCTLHPSSSYITSDGKRNQASAKDCGKLLENIYRGTCVSKKYSKEMLNLLKNQKVRYKIPAGLPSGIVCANKTGETSSVQHDMAIIYGKKTTYVLCVFSSGASEGHLQYGIRRISSMVYNYLN